MRVIPADHPGRLPDGGRHNLGLRRGGCEQLGVDLDAVLLPLAPHLRRRAPYHRDGAAPARGLDVAEEEAHDLLGLGGEGVGEAGEPHLLADLDLGQRHRRPPRPPPPGVSGRATRVKHKNTRDQSLQVLHIKLPVASTRSA